MSNVLHSAIEVSKRRDANSVRQPCVATRSAVWSRTMASRVRRAPVDEAASRSDDAWDGVVRNTSGSGIPRALPMRRSPAIR